MTGAAGQKQGQEVYPQRPGETEAERDDRNLAELLQELRVAGLGVQVIFGFLLSIPFTNRFATLGHAQRALYVVTMLLATVATALLLGPVAYHRLVFRRGQKRPLIRAANIMAISGLATVGLTISAAVLLVVSYVAPGAVAAVTAVFVVCLFASLWFVLPLIRRRGTRVAEPAPPAQAEPPRPPSVAAREGTRNDPGGR